jgi:hypothetical protein
MFTSLVCPILPFLSTSRLSPSPRPDITHNNPQNPSVNKKKQQARYPEPRDESTDAIELELKSLLQPHCLCADPERGSSEAEVRAR